MALSEGTTLLRTFYETHKDYRVQYDKVLKSGRIACTLLNDVYRASFVQDSIEYDVVSKELRICGTSQLNDNLTAYKVHSEQLFSQIFFD